MREREPLSRERVLVVAVGLADADGIAKLTMRRLAAELGVEAMSLYYHLPGKTGLLDGLLETVLAEVVAATRAVPLAGDWRVTLRGWFLAAREVMLRHPWAPGLLGPGRAIPPSVFAYYELILASLIEAGFSYRIAHRALHAFGSMPLGFVQETFGPAADGDLDEQQLAAMAETMPHVAAMVAAELHDAADPTLGWCDSGVEFAFTLDLLFDSLERYR
ncbi:TetR family transcriptional regulator [Dactylosporangium sp. NPDC051541]|uniref:TetR family transcriptional regulator n=1 Tax=Dactylosporangium sp. NPDC051541 TaxID=3363977 RepID=UPI00378C2A2A